MKTFCEIIASDYLPAIRALITQELIKTYHMTQTAVAKKMGMTQPAISYYLRELRGAKIKILRNNEKLMELVRKASAEIAAGKEIPVEMHWICKSLREDNILSDREKLQCCSLCK